MCSDLTSGQIHKNITEKDTFNEFIYFEIDLDKHISLGNMQTESVYVKVDPKDVECNLDILDFTVSEYEGKIC